MLTDYNKFRLSDRQATNHLWAEVNWKEGKDIDNCETIKFTLNGKTAYVAKKELISFLFLIGSETEQTKMIPQKLRTSRHYETTVGVKAKKNIAKGEEIVFPLKLTLPTFEQEIIGDLKGKAEAIKQKGKKIQILTP